MSLKVTIFQNILIHLNTTSHTAPTWFHNKYNGGTDVLNSTTLLFPIYGGGDQSYCITDYILCTQHQSFQNLRRKG